MRYILENDNLEIVGKQYLKDVGGYDGANADSCKDIATVFPNMVELTYSELKTLRDSSNLITGQQYRITDYITTTTQENTISAGHQFDIIVTADSENTLNEIARACLRDGDTYFSDAGANLEAWQIWYCLDNNTERFAWADTNNGKGVIYRMIDAWGNDLPYDFKNIKFKRHILNQNDAVATNVAKDGDLELVKDKLQKMCYQIHTCLWYYGSYISDIYPDAEPEAKYVPFGDIYYDNNGPSVLCKISEGTFENFEYFYTFHNVGGGDASLSKPNKEKYVGVWDNVIKNNNGAIHVTEDGRFEQCTYNNQYLNDIVLYVNTCYFNTFVNNCYSNTFGDLCNNNKFGNGCVNNTFGNYCHSNTFGNGCDSNTFGNECYNNTFGNDCFNNILCKGCFSNTFGNDCNYNTFGNSCYYNTFGDECYYNTFGNNCYSNAFGDTCTSNTFGNSCFYNTLGNDCSSNTFGNECYSNTFGNECYSNTFDTDCYFNTFGNVCFGNNFGESCYFNTFDTDCYSNTFGNGCYSNTFGADCSSNTFGNYCYSNTFGNVCVNNTFGSSKSSPSSYYRYIIIDNGNSYINLNCTSTTSSSKYYQNVRIGLGVNNNITYISYTTIEDTNVNQIYETLYKPEDSKIILIR
jgi:hypothetical protein